MRSFISLLLLVTILSCASEKDMIKRSRDLKFLSGIIEDYMFECFDANQLEVHLKSKFNSSDSSLTFFIGKSKYDYFQKWKIPLKNVYLDLDSIKTNHEFWSSVKIRGVNQDSVIQYSENNNDSIEFFNSFNVYLFKWCDNQKQEQFISSLKRINELSKMK